MDGQCLHIRSHRSDDALHVISTRADGALIISSVLVGHGMCIVSLRVDQPLSLRGARADQPLKIRSSVVCEVPTGYYLYVEPEVIWLLPDSADVDVRSNVTWEIE